eukprot:COSAG01_NODE_32874_length_573_cov_55.848101_1_plen_58_part_10
MGLVGRCSSGCWLQLFWVPSPADPAAGWLGGVLPTLSAGDGSVALAAELAGRRVVVRG